MLPAKYLQIGFQGYFMCRLATDPDPTNERRGRSGYTMALVREDPLDQVIRLESDDYVRRHLRDPARAMGITIGVTVSEVHFDGAAWSQSSRLAGAAVRLLGRDDVFTGPIFESRNNVVGSDDSLAFAIVPFILAIEQPDAPGRSAVSIRAEDHLNPVHPEQAIWEIDDPTTYGRRLPTAFVANSSEVQQAHGIFDYYGYFRDRRDFLADEISRLTATSGSDADGDQRECAIEEARSRIFQLDFWGERILNKMGFQLTWNFEINGPQSVRGDLGGTVDCTQPWPVSLWFGGWDGDLMVGYCRGSLSVPFQPGAAV